VSARVEAALTPVRLRGFCLLEDGPGGAARVVVHAEEGEESRRQEIDHDHADKAEAHQRSEPLRSGLPAERS
jgi:hypothetical protein